MFLVCDSKHSNKQMKVLRDCIHVDRLWDFSHAHTPGQGQDKTLILHLMTNLNLGNPNKRESPLK